MFEISRGIVSIIGFFGSFLFFAFLQLNSSILALGRKEGQREGGRSTLAGMERVQAEIRRSRGLAGPVGSLGPFLGAGPSGNSTDVMCKDRTPEPRVGVECSSKS